MAVFVSIRIRKHGEDSHPLLLLFLHLDIDHEGFVRVSRVEFGMVSGDMIHCVVFPDSLLAVRAVDWDVRAW